MIFSNYLAAFSKEFEGRIQDLRRNYLLLVENPWHIETAIITQLAALGFDYATLFDEPIEFNITNIEIIFKEKKEGNKYTEFWKLGNYR